MGQIRDQYNIHHLRKTQHDNCNFHRCFDVLTCVVTRRQDLDGDQSQQTHTVPSQCQSGLLNITVCKSTIVIEHRHQWLRKNQQGCSTRQCQQHNQTQAPIEHGCIFILIALRTSCCQLRHEHCAKSHTQNSGWEFHQSVCEGEPTDATGG